MPRTATAELADPDLFRLDDQRPGYCWAWQVGYRREKHGRVTRQNHSERFYARKSVAEADAAEAMRRDDPQLARLYGPLIAYACEVYTAVSCVERSEREAA